MGLQCLSPLLLCPADSSEPKSRISSLPSASALRKNCNIPAWSQPSAPRQLPPSRSLPNAPQTPRGTDAGSDLGLCPGTCEAFSASGTPLVSPRSPPRRSQRLAEATPVVIISVSPVVPVAAVLVVGPLSGQAVGPVAPGAVAARVSPVPVVVLLVPVLLALVVPVTAPRRVAAAAAAVAELPLPLPVPSICGKRRSALMAAGHRHSGLHAKAGARYKQALRPPLGPSAAG